MLKYDYVKINSQQELKAFVEEYIESLDIERIKSKENTHLVIPYLGDEMTFTLIEHIREELRKLNIFDKVTIIITSNVKKVYQDVLNSKHKYN